MDEDQVSTLGTSGDRSDMNQMSGGVDSGVGSISSVDIAALQLKHTKLGA